MTVGRVKDFTFPHYVSPKTIKYSGGGKLHLNIKKGALHQNLGIPQSQHIPTSRLHKAEHSSSPLIRKEATLAKNMRNWNKKAGGGAVHGASCSCPMCSGGMVRK